jgi:glycyl-tRNA synthetase beta chain
MKRARAKTVDLVLEIGTEEIPSHSLPKAVRDLEARAGRLLADARLPAREVRAYGTPRRLVLCAEDLPGRQETRVTEVLGPPRAAAYDSGGRPTAAANGFAKSQGVPVESLTVRKTEKGEYVCAVRKEPGLASGKILADLLPALILSLEFQKTMRWDGGAVRFVRPIRWLAAVLDGKVVPFRLGELKSGNRSRGHRFLAPKAFAVRGWESYRRELKRARVVLDPADREKIIVEALNRLAKGKKGVPMMDPGLLEQAVYLTEWPVVQAGSFDPKYLAIPAEVLVTAMKEHQGYFPVTDRKGRLLPHFLFVSNIETDKPDRIRAGNERVLRARLDDAKFYFERDRKHRLETLSGRLGEIVFHEKLGTLKQKLERLKVLATLMLREAGKDAKAVDRMERAVWLCKADLLTGMVREFPSLQGVIGSEYATLQGEDPEVAAAIAEHYFPRHADDDREPRTQTGKFLTAADRIDTLVGFFGIGETPSGSMDPYALRRHGMGLIQVLLDEAFSGVSLRRALHKAAELYPAGGVKLSKSPQSLSEDLERFLSVRMQTFLKRRFERKGGYRPDLADAVLSLPFAIPIDLYRRFVSLLIFHRQPQFEALMVTFKRADRIVPKDFKGEVDPSLFREKAEGDLYEACRGASESIEALMAGRNYPEVLSALSDLRRPIDGFFEGVMVMDEDAGVRANRLALLRQVGTLFKNFADFSRVSVGQPSG